MALLFTFPKCNGFCREFPEANKQEPTVPPAKPSVNPIKDPFVVLESESPSTYSSSVLFTDHLENISESVNLGSTGVGASSSNTEVTKDKNAFNGVSESDPFFSTEINEGRRDKSPLKKTENITIGHRQESPPQSPVDPFDDLLPKLQSNKHSDSQGSVGRSDLHSSATVGQNISDHQSPKSNEQLDTADDVWLTVDEIPLFTEPTTDPPPSRCPPPLAVKQTPFSSTVTRRDDESLYESSNNYTYNESAKHAVSSPIDELEELAMGKPQTYDQNHSDLFQGEEFETYSSAAASAAAMKVAMDRAEAKFRHAKEVRERERDAKAYKIKEATHQEGFEDNDEKFIWEQEQREREYQEKERKRVEMERQQELERDRERARQAVERATREARERAAAEARMKAERAAVVKVNAEARQRAERAAVQRAAAEARERAEREARERAERVAAEAREKSAAEAREKTAVERAASEARRRAERAAVERAAAEARERAAAEAREKAAAVAREKQQKPENDLESFFGMSTRATSAPKERFTSMVSAISH